MSTFEQSVLWTALPYASFVLLVAGLVWPDSCQFWRRRVVMGVFRWRGGVGVVGAGH